MGKGDPKTKRGKIIRGSRGNSRPKPRNSKPSQKKEAGQ
jgi:ribosomal small subunit protein bTHX